MHTQSFAVSIAPPKYARSAAGNFTRIDGMTFGWIKDSEGSTRNILRPGITGISMCFQGGGVGCLWRLFDVCKLEKSLEMKPLHF